MSAPLNFKKNLSWTLVGQGSNMLAQFAIIIGISRISNVETVGLFGIITAIVSPLQLFLKLDLGKLLITTEDFEKSFPYFNVVAVSTSILLPLISVVVYYLIYNDAAIYTIIAIALYRSMLNYREFCYAIYQKFERMDYMGKSLMRLSFVTIVLFVGTFYFTNNLALSFLALFIQYSISLVLFEFPRVKSFIGQSIFVFKYDKVETLSILKKGTSMGGTAAATSFKSNIPRYLIEFILEDRAILGFYTAFYQLANSMGYLNQTLAKTAIGKMNNLYRSSYSKFRKFFKKIIVVSTSIAVLILFLTVLLGPFVSSLLFGSEYGDYNYILVLLVLARVFVFPATYFKIMQIILNQINSQLVIMIFSMIILLILGLVLVHPYREIGVLAALVISEIFILIATVSLVVKKINNDR